jgi:hypothetical protein
MAHFAKVENGIVQQVIVVSNEILLDENEIEQEEIGKEFCINLFGGDWVQTSFNSSFRGKFAGIGMEWDGENFS